MCIIMAKKCKLPSSKKEKWFLYKVRDRNYSPKYSLNVEKIKDIETLFLTDQVNSWSEGVNSTGLMIVSAALDNHTDIEDNGQRSSAISAKQDELTNLLKLAMGSDSVDHAVKILIDGKFVGTTFVSDGDRLVIIEIYVNNEAFDREVKKYNIKELEKLSKAEQRQKFMAGITDDDYDVEFHETKKDTLAVRTNHGRLLDDAGYQKDDADNRGYTSSIKRYNYAKKAIEKLGDTVHPFEVLTTLKNLRDLEKEPQNNPIRPKGKPNKDGKMPYYSSTIVMLTPTGTLFAIPLDSEVDSKSSLRLKPDRKVDFVMLPKNLPLFEGFRTQILEGYLG